MAPWSTDEIPDQHGRTALVTGASDGLGLETALVLAARGATVLLGCRTREKGERAQAKVAETATGPAPALVRLDLADLDSVRTTADTLNRSLTRLDLLVNNAGIMAVPRADTVDGFESQFATNHLGHFALTGLLLPSLLRAAAPRVVTLSSGAHRLGRPRWDDPNWRESRYRAWPAYARSKLANLQFMFELARRAEAAGAPLLSAAAHPGYAATNLTAASAAASGHRLRGAVMVWGARLAGRPAGRGALPQLYAATMPDVAPGDYWGPDGPGELWGHPTRVDASKAARDLAAATRLWEVSASLTGVTYDWRDARAGSTA
jgi:NAD(P)-dependent dehydrogenase (short-subunit alcohol dehydrogenase family)